ncbi:MAG TPA: quinone oxidoreductase [Kofleriaceae bacterium]|jgi:NADPH2:quinone reductase|nr:quinone oxidoreductase [Kofleriaceae bacterium]
MRAIQIEAHGGPEQLQLVDLPVPEPKAGEVRVRHHAIGVNFLDVYHRTGLYKAALPLVLGTEGAGVIDAVGAGVTHLAVGDRVGYAARTPGSYAEARTLDSAQVVKLPDAIDFEHAAAMMLKGLTVQFLLERTLPVGGLHAGDAILWHAAAGGVGLIACQWAKALGLALIGTAGSAAKCELATRHGAAHVIDYSKADVVARVRELTGGKGVKAVYDSVGKDTWDRSIDCLAPLGLMVSFGNASGPPPLVSLPALMVKGSLYVTRPTLQTHIATRELVEDGSRRLFEMVAGGKVTIEVGAKFPLQDAAKAHVAMEARKTTGSTILTV